MALWRDMKRAALRLYIKCGECECEPPCLAQVGFEEHPALLGVGCFHGHDGGGDRNAEEGREEEWGKKRGKRRRGGDVVRVVFMFVSLSVFPPRRGVSSRGRRRARGGSNNRDAN